jgi:predicted transcriptional regulator
MVNTAYELEVTVGGHRFRGKGDRASVRQDYERFLAALREQPTWTQPRMRAVGKPWPEIEPPLDEIFRAHEDGCLSLKKELQAPLKNQRAMVVLLYGYLRFEQEAVVKASQLLLSASRSNIQTERVDRLLQRYVDKGLVERMGNKKGTQYRLSEAGVEFAKSQIEVKQWH